VGKCENVKIYEEKERKAVAKWRVELVEPRRTF
jgi:hypothetical protein